MIISKVCNLGHTSVLRLLTHTTTNFDDEYFQIGLPSSSFPKIRGSLLFTADIDFLKVNINSIAKIEVIDVVGCKLRLEENSQDLKKFNSEVFTIARESYEQFFVVLEELVSPATKYTLSRYDSKIKNVIREFLPIQENIDEQMWLIVPTFIQISLNGLAKSDGVRTGFVVPNWFRRQYQTYASTLLYYNPRGGIEAGIEEYLLNRNI